MKIDKRTWHSVFVFVAYLGTALLGLQVDAVDNYATLFWPPSGIAIASLLILGYRSWPAIALAAFAANWLNGGPLGADLLISIGNTLGPLAAVNFLKAKGFHRSFSVPSDCLFFLAAIGLGSAVSASIGFASLSIAGVARPHDHTFLFIVWWLGDLMGALLIAPVILVNSRRFWSHIWQDSNTRIEAAVLCVLVLVVGAVVFLDAVPAIKSSSKIFLIFPLVVWSAARFGQPGASIAIFLSTSLAIWSAFLSRGPFVGPATGERLLHLPVFVASLTLTGLLLAAFVSERKKAQEQLKTLNENLDEKVRERTAMLAVTNEALTKHEIFLDFVQKIVHLGCWEWEITSDKTTWSKELYELFEIDPTKFKADYAGYLSLLPDHDRPRVDKILRDALLKRSSFRFEHSIVLRSGEVRHLCCRGTIRRDRDGKAVEMIGTAQDVTREHRFAVELREARLAAQAANRAKSNFLANMSHEIRTPLSVILGFSELLSEPQLSAQEKQGFIVSIQRNGHLLSNLISDILDLSKIEAGKVQIDASEVQLPELIEHVRGLLENKVKVAGLAFDISISGRIPKSIVTDQTRLCQIFVNIVGNAIRFTRKGRIDIRTHFQSGTGKDLLAFDVSDTGIGLTPEARARIFKPFVQADNSTTRLYGGTGLGLILSKRLAQALGGDVIIVDSGAGKGTTFRITIDPGPLEKNEWIERLEVPNVNVQGANALQTRANALPLLGKRVLLVDDLTENRQLFSRFLSAAGAVVESASNGVEGLQAALAGKFDVVLMDIQMPYMDGVEATRRLRESGCRLPIIALTAHALSEERRKYLDSGFSDYLSKPVARPVLIDHVASAHF